MDGKEQGEGGGSDRAVLTCQGDLSDPCFPAQLQYMTCKLHRLTDDGKGRDFEVTKVEPWNSVRVTFNIPHDAARRLRRLAESGDPSLRELGILSVQIGGDQVITLTLSNSSSLSMPGTANLLLGKVTSPPPPNRSAYSIPFANDRIHSNNSSPATSQLSVACEPALKVPQSSPVCEGRGGAGPPVITSHQTSQTTVTAAAAHHRRHPLEGQEENSKSVCTVISAQYLNSSEPPDRSQSYPSPSSSPADLRQVCESRSGTSIDHFAATSTVTSPTTTTTPSHCPTAIPSASFASSAVPVSDPADQPVVPLNDCNTSHADRSSAGAILRIPNSTLVNQRIDSESPESEFLTLSNEPDPADRFKEDKILERVGFENAGDPISHEFDSNSTRVVMNCSEMEEDERTGSPDVGGDGLPCLKSSNESSGGSCSPDQDTSLRSSTSPSSTSTTTTASRMHQPSRDSPADSPSHDMQLLCNTSVRQSSSSNDSPLRELQNTSPSHHSDSGIASSASQQETDPQPVLRQAIDCNNSPDEHRTDDERHADHNLAEHHKDNSHNNSSSCSHDEASISSGSESWRAGADSPPVTSFSSVASSHPSPVLQFASVEPATILLPLASKPVLTTAPAADSVVQTSPFVAHPESSDEPAAAPVVSLVNGTSHLKCSDDEASSRSPVPSAAAASPLSPVAHTLSASRSDQTDTTPNLCFNDGETRAFNSSVVVLPDPSSVVLRQIHSVASGDHNYVITTTDHISVIDGRDGDWVEVRQNHRNSNHTSLVSSRLAEDTSALPISRIDQNHSDLNTRPNKRRKCSSSTSSSENIQTIGLEADPGRGSSSINNSSRPADQPQRSSVCSSESSADSAPLRNNCKFPIMNGHTYEV